ncbi:MAG: hypothetical protein Q9227_007054 [Pyrenula ochraceoflavens]
MPKSTTTATTERRHKPLADDIASIGHLRNKSTGKRKSRDGENGDGYVDAASSRKILHLAQDLADEDVATRIRKPDQDKPNTAFDFASRDIKLDSEASEARGTDNAQWEDEEEWLPDENIDEEDVDPADLAVYQKFLPQRDTGISFNPLISSVDSSNKNEPAPDEDGLDGPPTNLTELILARIAEKEALEASQSNGRTILPDPNEPSDIPQIPEKVAEVFSKIAQLLSRYKSGPLPKPFKVLPTLPDWPTLLDLTQPDSWTPNAVFAATRIFVSSTPSTVQHFLQTVLLDRVREDIYEHRKLNVHLYNALKKSLYKPSAFFKGFLFPLVQSGTCTLREAHIISSVLAKISIPVLHSAAALLRLCEIAAEQSSVNSESAGAANVFIRTLLEKKYALPYRAIDALVFHFLRFRNSNPAASAAEGGDVSMSGATKSEKDDLKLPVLWHQGLLVFAQRYKNDITEDQREALLDLLLVRGHKDIGPEVRRELLEGRGRGVMKDGLENGEVGLDGDDTMADVR